jgi:hypothetical protein
MDEKSKTPVSKKRCLKDCRLTNCNGFQLQSEPWRNGHIPSKLQYEPESPKPPQLGKRVDDANFIRQAFTTSPRPKTTNDDNSQYGIAEGTCGLTCNNAIDCLDSPVITHIQGHLHITRCAVKC